MERIQRNTPSTLSVTFYANESPVDPDGNAVTVSAVKADGTSHIAPVAATRTGVGVYTYPMASQVNLQFLTFTWTGLISGVSTSLYTEAEIVGGFYWTVAQLRDYDSSLTLAKYSYAKMVEARMDVEHEFERICNRAFVPRFGRETLTGDGTNQLWLVKPDVHRITKLTVDGTDKLADWVTSNLIRVDKDATNMLYFEEDTGEFTEQSDIVIEYEHGMKSVPFPIFDKSRIRARAYLTGKNARIDERVSVVNADGFGRFNLATPGMEMGFGRYVRSGLGVWYTGMPEVDVVLKDFIYEPAGVA
jgi:hypothetical protein